MHDEMKCNDQMRGIGMRSWNEELERGVPKHGISVISHFLAQIFRIVDPTFSELSIFCRADPDFDLKIRPNHQELFFPNRPKTNSYGS